MTCSAPSRLWRGLVFALPAAALLWLAIYAIWLVVVE